MDAVTRELATHANDGATLLRRQTRYAALAEFFSGPSARVRSAVRWLASPCVPGIDCPLNRRPLSTAANFARVWCDSSRDLARLEAEYERLFEGSRPIVSPYAPDYMPESARTIRDAVLGYYQRLDCPGCGHARADDPLHISSQLRFMAHCLDRERCGLGAGLDTSLFFADQLLPWAPMFARAVLAATADPVYRFAALAFEQVLKCESMVLLAGRREV